MQFVSFGVVGSNQNIRPFLVILEERIKSLTLCIGVGGTHWVGKENPLHEKQIYDSGECIDICCQTLLRHLNKMPVVQNICKYFCQNLF